MESSITVITLGVKDLEAAVSFYRDGLGFRTDGIIGKEFEYGAVAFFQLQSGLKLALWPRASISHDTGLPVNQADPTTFTLGHNVDSIETVNNVMAQAKKAGATIVKSADKTFYGGYAGYFQDLDGHLWEVVFNPAFDSAE